MTLILLFGLCLSIQPCYAKVSYGSDFDHLNVAPVFLISNDNVFNFSQDGANPFKTTKQAEFADIIYKTVLKSDIIIVFSENNLCVEDISSKDDNGTLFPNLRKTFLDKKARYLPSVQNPHSVLTQMLAPLQSKVLYTGRIDAKFRLPTDQNKHFYVFFDDGANESRASVLRRHDAILNKVWNIATGQSKGVICAIYTGKVNQIARSKPRPRVIQPSEIDHSVLVASERALFRFGKVKLASVMRTRSMVGSPVVAEETWKRNKLSIRLAYSDFELEFNFWFRKADWELDHVRLIEDGEEVGRTLLRIGAPWRMSYVCGEPIVILNNRDGSTITISDYQIQPFMSESIQGRRDTDEEKPNKKPEFGNFIHCGPYFTVAILSALFVVGLMLGIVLVGITMLMNCPSNDRYDDPNGKPFVVRSM